MTDRRDDTRIRSPEDSQVRTIDEARRVVERYEKLDPSQMDARVISDLLGYLRAVQMARAPATIDPFAPRDQALAEAIALARRARTIAARFHGESTDEPARRSARRILDEAAQGKAVDPDRLTEATRVVGRGGLSEQDAQRIVDAAEGSGLLDQVARIFGVVSRSTAMVSDLLKGPIGFTRFMHRLGGTGSQPEQSLRLPLVPLVIRPGGEGLAQSLRDTQGDIDSKKVDTLIRKSTGFGAFGILREAVVHARNPNDPKFGFFWWLPRGPERLQSDFEPPPEEFAVPRGGPGGTARPGAGHPSGTRATPQEARFRELASELGLGEDEIEQRIDGIYEAAANTALMAAQGMEIPGSEGFTVEGLFAAEIRMLEAEVEAARGAPLGVPPGFAAQRPIPGTARGGPGGIGLGAAPLEFDTEDVEPRYFAGDEFSPAMTPTLIRSLQRRLVEAGLLQEDQYWKGWWDDASATAYRVVLEHANRSGRTADETLTRLVQRHQAEPEPPRPQFQPSPFIRPDPAALAQTVKLTFRAQVGRDPTPDELAEMTGLLTAGFRQAHEAQTAAERAVFEAGVTLSETGEPTDLGTFPDVDPVARFREIFESRFRPERERLEGLEDVHRNTQNVMASLRTMSALVGGR